MGAWIETYVKHPYPCVKLVASYVGAWIETQLWKYFDSQVMSHPMWVRGLKHTLAFLHLLRVRVASYVGAWIETLYVCH